ncbi:MAG: peptidase S41, partial [Planctomycetota bacterium]|nr:peptidase S41 [Planctomycetota bacterium]
MTIPSLLLALPVLAAGDFQSPPATLLRYPDIGKDSIVFSFAGALWRVPSSGGDAAPVASPPGSAGFAKFSPDGSTIAFVGDYNGGRDLYTIPSAGGVPFQVTHHPAGETLNEWTADGRLLFTAGGMGVYPRATELYLVPATGGLPEPLPVPYGANGTIDSTGTWLAYTLHSVDHRTWKRYRGGMATDIWIYNLKTSEARQVTTWEGVDTIPMWHGDTLYYLSDEGEGARSNIWRFNPKTGQRLRLTSYTDFDVKWPSVGSVDGSAGEIVFQHGADLVVLNLQGNTTRTVSVRIPGNRPELAVEDTNVAGQLGTWNTGPSAKRAIVDAHGDIFTLPAENGSPRNLTNTSGVAERYPTWSPDGTWMAWFDDSAGDGYDLYIAEAETLANRRRLTTDGIFKQEMNWSPDSKKIAYTDKTGTLYVVDVESAERTEIGKERFDENIPLPAWSHDASWLAWTQTLPAEPFHGIFIRDMESGEVHRLSSGQFPAGRPTFDRKGDWLYAATDQSFNVTYSSLDTTWIYGESEVLVAFPLRSDVKSPKPI